MREIVKLRTSDLEPVRSLGQRNRGISGDPGVLVHINKRALVLLISTL